MNGLIDHSGMEGFYLLCDCPHCSKGAAEAKAQHDANCHRKDGSPCAYHKRFDCHCDCRKL